MTKQDAETLAAVARVIGLEFVSVDKVGTELVVWCLTGWKHTGTPAWHFFNPVERQIRDLYQPADMLWVDDWLYENHIEIRQWRSDALAYCQVVSGTVSHEACADVALGDAARWAKMRAVAALGDTK